MEEKRKHSQQTTLRKWISTYRRWNLIFIFHCLQKQVEKKCIKELYLEPKALRLLEENKESILQDIGIVKNF